MIIISIYILIYFSNFYLRDDTVRKNDESFFDSVEYIYNDHENDGLEIVYLCRDGNLCNVVFVNFDTHVSEQSLAITVLRKMKKSKEIIESEGANLNIDDLQDIRFNILKNQYIPAKKLLKLITSDFYKNNDMKEDWSILEISYISYIAADRIKNPWTWQVTFQRSMNGKLERRIFILNQNELKECKFSLKNVLSFSSCMEYVEPLKPEL